MSAITYLVILALLPIFLFHYVIAYVSAASSYRLAKPGMLRIALLIVQYLVLAVLGTWLLFNIWSLIANMSLALAPSFVVISNQPFDDVGNKAFSIIILLPIVAVISLIGICFSAYLLSKRDRNVIKGRLKEFDN